MKECFYDNIGFSGGDSGLINAFYHTRREVVCFEGLEPSLMGHVAY